MDIYFRGISHIPDELAMGHVIWFQAAAQCDAISATANIGGFTPLTAIARHFGWPVKVVTRAANACNLSGRVITIGSLVPTLLLLPKTRGRGNAEHLVTELFKAISGLSSEVTGLHFTHFGFLQTFPEREISDCLRVILRPDTPQKLRRLVFDIDQRRRSRLYWLMSPNSVIRDPQPAARDDARTPVD